MMLDPVDVLLAEDNEAEIELARLALMRRNITGVHIVRDGAEALEFIFCTGEYASRNPDYLPRVIILDINMPKVNGLVVLERIRSHERTRTLPVIIMTNSNTVSDRETAKQWNATRYLQKPLDFHEFVSLLSDVVSTWL